MTRRALTSPLSRARAALLEIAACELSQAEQSSLARVTLGLGDMADQRRVADERARVDAMADRNEDLERRRRA
jgi:hypothetical protein